MATMHRRQRQSLRQLPEPIEMGKGGIGKFFADIGKGIFEGIKGIGDFVLGTIGAPDIIDNSFVDRSKFLSGLNNVVGTVGRTALNVVAPGVGTAVGAIGKGLNQFGIPKDQRQMQPGWQYQNMGYAQPFGSPNFGTAMQFLPGLGLVGGLFNQLANQENRSGNPVNLGASGFSGGFPGGFSGGFGNVGGSYTGAGNQVPFSPMALGNQGGLSVPGFAGGSFNLGNLGNMFSGFGFEKGSTVRKYQTGGMVDIQAEKGELIFHPTGYLTPVHAKKSHRSMERSGDDDMITDHPLEGSFIFSDYLKLKKSDADQMLIGVKRHPYEEGKKGKQPEIFTIGDLFSKKEKKKTPAQLAGRVSNIFKVTNDENDMFNVLGDQMNLQNRIPYLQGLSMLSEVEREKDDIEEAIDDLDSMIFAKKGGKLKSRRVRFNTPFYNNINMEMMQAGGEPGLPYAPNPWEFMNPPLPQIPSLPIPPVSGGPSVFNPPTGSHSGPFVQPLNPIPSIPLPPEVISQTSTPFDPKTEMDAMLGPQIDAWNAQRQYFQGLQQQQQNGQMMTQFQDMGSPFLRGFGQAAIPIGGGINFGANLAGAIGSYNLNNNFINENRSFFEGQRGLAGQSRDIASAGNLFDVGLNFMQQGPVDQEERFSSRVRQFDPYRQVGMSRQLADQSLGQINTMIRNNPDIRGVNVGNAIAQNNQGIASAYANAAQQQFGIDQYLDQEDYFNQGVRTGNQQRRVDFGNSLIQGARPGFQGFFSNEASRPLDMLGLNSAERQADIAFRQNRLFQPIEFLSTAGNSLANLGASAVSLGTNYVPQQVPVGAAYGQQGGGGGGLNDILGTVGNITNILGSLGIFEKGGSVKRNK